MNKTSLSPVTPATGGTFELAHQILVLDAFLEKRLDDRRRESITRCFVDELLAVLDMQPLGKLGIYPAVDQRAPGWSFIQPITTSHVSAHYFEKPGRKPNLRFDAYSCEPFDWKGMIAVCHRHFGFDDWQGTFIHRHIDVSEGRDILRLAGRGAAVLSECFMLPQTAVAAGS